jgi:hypothetical protein
LYLAFREPHFAEGPDGFSLDETVIGVETGDQERCRPVIPEIALALTA